MLQIDPSSDLESIKKAFRTQVRKYHPDIDPSESAKDKFNHVVEAFDVLSHSERRKVYDDYLAEKRDSELAVDPVKEFQLDDWKRESKRRSEKYKGIELEEFLMLGFIAETGIVDGLLDGAGNVIDSISDALDGISDLF